MLEFLRRILSGGPARDDAPSPAPAPGDSPAPIAPEAGETLRRLALGEMGMLPFAAALVLWGDAATRRAAAGAMLQAVERIPPAGRARVDASVRRGHNLQSWYAMGSWTDDGRGIRALPEDTETDVFGLLSLNGSGRAREAAVERLATRGAAALPWLLLRANDWIRPVAERADAAVRALLSPAHVDAWVAALPEAYALASGGRRPGALARDVAAFLGGRDAAPAVLAALTRLFYEDRQVARWAFDVLAEGRWVPETELIEKAQWADDAVTRHHAAKLLSRAGEDAVRAASHMARDASSRVRAEYLRHLAEILGPDAWTELHDALLDPSANVRALAVHHLRILGAFDPAEFYRAAAARPANARPTVVALRGLEEYGEAQDAQLALAYTISLRPRVRAAAVEAYAALAAAPDPDFAIRMLDDRHARVREAAKRAVARLAARRG
jgi:hypothetical protein